MSVGAFCNREVIVTGKDTSIAEAAQLMRRHHVGDVVVVEETNGRKPIGLVTDRDIVLEVMAQDLDPSEVTVMDVITETIAVESADADFWDALATMRKRGIRRLPIVNEAGGLEGILTLDDALELVGEAMADLVALVSRGIDRERKSRPEHH